MANRPSGCTLEKLIYKGAESEVHLGRWFGEKAIFKVRVSRPFRHPELDRRLIRLRSIHESILLSQAKLAGVATPFVYSVNPEAGEIVMEHLEGERLKDLLSTPGDHSWAVREFGRLVGRLHSAGIVHGDLTTSNVMVRGDELAVIDFGLAVYSSKLEDRAVDLHLVKQVLQSAHSELFELGWRSFMEGYGEVRGREECREVLKRVSSIEARGRYARPE